jgi:putative intracellular protease/amidase
VGRKARREMYVPIFFYISYWRFWPDTNDLKAISAPADLAHYTDVRPKGVWDDFHVVDGRLVTGTNPQSAKSTARAALEVFEKL